MPGQRGSRFALEVFFLVALAVGLTVAEARPLAIAGVMALGWLVVAGIEWALWRDEPHYASGLPPRWYVPRVNLPPAQPLDPVVSGYPEGRRDEAPTWIASPALRREVLGEWPVAGPLAGDEEAPIEGAIVEGTVVERIDVEDADEAVEPEAWTIVELPPEPAAAAAVSDPEPEPEPAPAEDDLAVELVRSAAGTARYSLEPLADAPKRRFGRRGEEPPTIPVPARPDGPRVLPDALPEES